VIQEVNRGRLSSPKFAEEIAKRGHAWLAAGACESKAGPMGPAQATGLPHNEFSKINVSGSFPLVAI
jgi:hypothetical protein